MYTINQQHPLSTIIRPASPDVRDVRPEDCHQNQNSLSCFPGHLHVFIDEQVTIYVLVVQYRLAVKLKYHLIKQIDVIFFIFLLISFYI